MEIFIGCPIYEREWIIREWLWNVEEQCNPKKVSLVFAITDGVDKTRDIIEENHARFKQVVLIDGNDLPAYRDRNIDRFNSLVILRNRIFEFLRETQLDYYFSWDSDILLPPGTLQQLIADDKDAVGPWVDLCPPGNRVPNCARRGPGDSFKRPKPIEHYFPMGELYKVDAIFACFLMKPQVWQRTYYQWHTGGEDFGWALSMADAGLECWMDSRIVGQHFYNKLSKP